MLSTIRTSGAGERNDEEFHRFVDFLLGIRWQRVYFFVRCHGVHFGDLERIAFFLCACVYVCVGTCASR